MNQPVPRRKRESRFAPLLVVWILTWAAGMLLWLLLTSTVLPSEVAGGVAAAALAASALAFVRVADRPLSSPKGRRFRLGNVLSLPAQVVIDTGIVFRELAHHVFGRRRSRSKFVKVPLRVERTRAKRETQDLLTTVRVSITPNTYVVGIDEDEQTVLLHQLVSRNPRSLRDLLSPRR
jgi:multisubunit Na+/H+ antiporter MnhE subunit